MTKPLTINASISIAFINANIINKKKKEIRRRKITNKTKSFLNALKQQQKQYKLQQNKT